MSRRIQLSSFQTVSPDNVRRIISWSCPEFPFCTCSPQQEIFIRCVLIVLTSGKSQRNFGAKKLGRACRRQDAQHPLICCKFPELLPSVFSVWPCTDFVQGSWQGENLLTPDPGLQCMCEYNLNSNSSSCRVIFSLTLLSLNHNLCKSKWQLQICLS